MAHIRNVILLATSVMTKGGAPGASGDHPDPLKDPKKWNPLKGVYRGYMGLYKGYIGVYGV